MILILTSCSRKVFFQYDSFDLTTQLEIRNDTFTVTSIDRHRGGVHQSKGAISLDGNIICLRNYGFKIDSSRGPHTLVIDTTFLMPTQYYLLKDDTLFILSSGIVSANNSIDELALNVIINDTQYYYNPKYWSYVKGRKREINRYLRRTKKDMTNNWEDF